MNTELTELVFILDRSGSMRGLERCDNHWIQQNDSQAESGEKASQCDNGIV